MITQQRLKELARYNPVTGELLWIKQMGSRGNVGAQIGTDNGNGYRRGYIDKRRYYIHHLVWVYVYGEWPLDEIDHKDGNGFNNRIDNLRLATHAENGQNQALRKTNTSGKHGVSWNKLHSQWESYIWIRGKKKYLGLFSDLKSAGEAYLRAKSFSHPFQPAPRDVAACR